MEYGGYFGVFYCILLYFLKLVWKMWKPLRDQEKIGVRSFYKISKQNMFKIHNTRTAFPVAQGDAAQWLTNILQIGIIFMLIVVDLTPGLNSIVKVIMIIFLYNWK